MPVINCTTLRRKPPKLRGAKTLISAAQPKLSGNAKAMPSREIYTVPSSIGRMP